MREEDVEQMARVIAVIVLLCASTLALALTVWAILWLFSR